jgi:AcrR family transcriptional regulator
LTRKCDLSARERILAAAEKLFAERGFDHTSTARVAAEAGVPHGLIFYHFKTKMDLLLALIRDDRVTALDDLRPALDTGTGLHQAVIELWIRLSTLLGQPSAVRKIIIQELAAHPEVRQRAMELHNQIVAIVSRHLAQASGPAGTPRPEHEAAARLLTIAAGMAPLLGEPSLGLVQPEALATLLSAGLARR